MTLRSLCALAALIASCLVAAVPASGGEQPPKAMGARLSAGTEEARVIVRFRQGAATVAAHAVPAGADRKAAAGVLQRRADVLGARRGVALTTGRAISQHMQVLRAQGMDAATLARVLASDPEVEYAEVDHRRTRTMVPTDPLFAPAAGSKPSSGQWYLKAPSTETPASIDAAGAWDTSVGNTGMVVAVLDTGVRFDHEDLVGKLLTGRDMVSDATVANDGNARDADASDPGDYITSADVKTSTFSSCTTADSSWHGTMVSGLIGAASNNAIGMAGVSWNARILPVRVLGKCFGYDSDIVAGMRWAAGLAVPGEPTNPTPARVLNLSLGGDGACSTTYGDAVNAVVAAGAVVVAAAGNGNGRAVEAPANCPGVIAVAGVRHIGTKVGYSDIGPEVAIAAPAGNCVNDVGGDCIYPILSTTNAGTQGPVAASAGGSIYTDSFNYSVGTSFSSPLVAGTAALMLSVNPTLTPAQVKSLLQSSARAFPTSGDPLSTGMCQAPTTTDQVICYCTTSTCGAGMLDSGAAVRAAAALASPPPGGLQAAMSIDPVVPTAGQTITLTATPQVGAPHTITSYGWSVVAGSGTSFNGPTNAATAQLAVSTGGDVLIRLTVSDDAGNTSSVDQPLRVVGTASASTSPGTGTITPATSSSSSSGGGGGGGALGWPWLAALAAAVFARRRVAAR